MTALNLLILEDQADDAELLVRELDRAGFEPHWRRVDTRAEFEAHLQPGLDVILADYSLPQFDALQALTVLQERGLDVPLIVVTGSFEEMAIECMKRGAADYLIKDRLKRLGLAVRQVLEDRQLRAEKRLAEERARRQDRMAAVGQLAAGIAPNFNNVLVSIVLHSEMVLGSLELSRRDEDRIRTILQQAERGAFLTRQILDFSSRSRLESVVVDLTQLMEELATALRPSLPPAIQLRIEAPGEPLVVEVDPGRVHQALLNLASNAQEAMPQGGELRFTLDRLQLGPDDPPPLPELPPGEWIRMRVADTGRGIRAADLPHVFEPFFTTKRADAGAGLGLSQTYGIVKQHGGQLAVASVEGERTEFTIYLPAAGRGARLEAKPTPATEQEAYGHTILVVDDDRPTRQAICELLQALGYRTLQAGDGQQALELAQGPPEPISLVLSDLVMPEVGGVELLHRLHALRLEVPMLLMTSYPLGDQTEELSDYGLVGWLEKPVTESLLIRSLRSVLAPQRTG